MERVGTMVRLDLSAEEAGVLLDVLEDYVSDLRMEVSNTDNMTFREALKAKEAILNGLIARLK
jgi:hypothetical protein